MHLILAAGAAAALAAFASPAAAHGLVELLSAQSLAERLPLVFGAALLALAWAAYALGAHRRPPRRGQGACFHAAAALTALAAFGPLDAWAERSAAAHMAQHMLFILVAAPLWAVAAPLPQWRAACGRACERIWPLVPRVGAHPLALALLHALAIWFWHTPRLYRLALDGPWWHLAEHACFLLSAWFFWWSVLHAGSRNIGQALLAVLLTLMHTGLLGALLTFARVPFYVDARGLADQQLAGLIMWVPGGAFYLAAGAWITWRRLTAERIGAS